MLKINNDVIYMKTKSQIVLSLNDQGFTLEDAVSRFLFNKIEKNIYNNKEQYVLDIFNNFDISRDDRLQARQSINQFFETMLKHKILVEE